MKGTAQSILNPFSAFQDRGDLVYRPVGLLLVNHIRRHEIEHIAQGTQQESASQKLRDPFDSQPVTFLR